MVQTGLSGKNLPSGDWLLLFSCYAGPENGTGVDFVLAIFEDGVEVPGSRIDVSYTAAAQGIELSTDQFYTMALVTSTGSEVYDVRVIVDPQDATIFSTRQLYATPVELP